jgi:hypothetical protein
VRLGSVKALASVGLLAILALKNYGDGNLASTNNRNLGNTPAETQRNTKLVEQF